MICPACRNPHKGPRETSDAHHEAAQVLVRAAERPTAEAKEWMRVNFLRLGFELSGFCPGCVLDAQTMLGAASFSSSFATVVRETEQAMQGATGEVHLDNVVPIDRARRTGVYDIGVKYDSEVKRP